MDALNFVYWLQGYFELSPHSGLTPDQVQVIKNHLALVFQKQTPYITINTPQIVPTPKTQEQGDQPWWMDIPICSSAPKITFDGREPIQSPPPFDGSWGEKAWDL